MTRRALAFLGLFLVLALIGAQTGRQLFVSLSYLLGGTLVFSLLWAWLNLRWLGISRTTLAARTQVGRPVEERLLVRNLGYLPKLWVEIRDESELPGHHVSRVIHSLGPRLSRTWSVKTSARYRGQYRLGPMALRSGDPFGLFSFNRKLPQTSIITVYPATLDLPGFLPPLGQLMGAESRRRRTQHVTPDFAGVRDYMPGDARSRIHWGSTARTGRLIVKEFEEDPTSDLWIVLDMAERAYAETDEMPQWLEFDALTAWFEALPDLLPSTTEYGVTAAASLLRHFLAQNRAVGMISHGRRREIMQPDRGMRPLTRSLEYLAVLEAEGVRPLAEVLVLEQGFFTRGTTLILVTSEHRPGWVDVVRDLQRRGIRVVAVLVDAHSFDPEKPTLQRVRSKLAILGTPTYVIREGEDIAVALGRMAAADDLDGRSP